MQAIENEVMGTDYLCSKCMVTKPIYFDKRVDNGNGEQPSA